jgi:hypothetical protein
MGQLILNGRLHVTLRLARKRNEPRAAVAAGVRGWIVDVGSASRLDPIGLGRGAS